MPRTHFHTVYLEDDTEIFIEYEQSQYFPAKISGPPEDCYPAEGGEVEIINVFVDDGTGKNVPYHATNEQIEEWTAEIEQLPIEDDFGPDPDYAYDRMRDEKMMGYD